MTVQEEIFMEKETEKQNLGSGSIPGLMIKLAVPTIIAQLVNLLYNLVDRIYIGHIREVGDIALTGLGLCFPVLMMVTAFAMLIGSGGAPRAAIYMGKGDNETAERILGNSVTSLIVISVVLPSFWKQSRSRFCGCLARVRKPCHLHWDICGSMWRGVFLS